MRLRRLLRSLSYALRCKRNEYKFTHERPTDYDIKMYLEKRRLERQQPLTMEQKIAQAMAKLKEQSHGEVKK